MPKGHLAKSLIVISMFALGGCKFFGNLHFSSNSHAKAAPADLAQGTYGPATQRGRDYLRSNLTGLAIDSFNLGLATGEEPAADYNGLGVAYARLGRTDLAYRFFKKATMSDPANPAYTRNLINLINSPEFTLNLLARTPLPEDARAGPQPEARTANVAERAPQVPGKLYREGNRQFSLITVVPAQAIGGSSVLNAAADGCILRTTARARRGCGAIPLPKVESRNNRSETVALTAPAAATPSPAANDVAPTPAAKGKAKVLELTAPKQTLRSQSAAESDSPATT